MLTVFILINLILYHFSSLVATIPSCILLAPVCRASTVVSIWEHLLLGLMISLRLFEHRLVSYLLESILHVLSWLWLTLVVIQTLGLTKHSWVLIVNAFGYKRLRKGRITIGVVERGTIGKMSSISSAVLGSFILSWLSSLNRGVHMVDQAVGTYRFRVYMRTLGSWYLSLR